LSPIFLPGSLLLLKQAVREVTLNFKRYGEKISFKLYAADSRCFGRCSRKNPKKQRGEIRFGRPK